jgi:hypothetical protein
MTRNKGARPAGGGQRRDRSEHCGQTGASGDLCGPYGSDARAIIAAAEAHAPGRPIRHLGVV